LPSLLTVRRDAKRDKLLRYAEQVWTLTEGDDDQRIEAAIARTRDFFESLGIKTRLSEYEIGRDGIDALLAQLVAHGMTKLGERRAITPEISRAILEGAF
jgi:NADP-dependent alcohol dehydrogenase